MLTTVAELHAITVRPPWSWAIAHGGKTVINRPRPTDHRGLLAIHAGTRWDRAGALDRRVRAAWHRYIAAELDAGAEIRRDDLVPAQPSLVIGAIVAVAQLTDCHVRGLTCDSAGCLRWGAPGQFHLVLDHVQPLARPVPCAGRLAVLWRLPADVADQVFAQLGGTVPKAAGC